MNLSACAEPWAEVTKRTQMAIKTPITLLLDHAKWSLVRIGGTQHGVDRPLLFSAFLFSFIDEWFVVTAGHTMERLSKAMVAGASFSDWELHDNHQEGRGPGIPFEMDLTKWMWNWEEHSGIDAAVYRIPAHLRRLLEAGGSKAFASVDDIMVMAFDVLAVAGTPLQTFAPVSGDSVKFGVVALALARIEDVSELPALEGSTLRPHAFFGKPIDIPRGINDLDGLSGAPIFALVLKEKGIQFTLVGIQQGWYRDTKIVVGCKIEVIMNLCLKLLVAQSAKPSLTGLSVSIGKAAPG